MSLAVVLALMGLSALATATKQIHLVPHTHDDPGWLKTVDQYYYGSNETIYQTGVQYILDTVVQQLNDDPAKTFTYVEMSFFQRWYTEQPAKKRLRVKKLVKAGQLSFANGGWSMHDEASAHYASMIDQTTLGHRFLKDEFDFKPRVGWQIDPFGHSATNAWLMSAEVGFDALYFGRINYDDREARAAEKRLEFVWQASPSQPGSTVFTGVFSDGNYQPPPGICFDLRCDNDPVMDDGRLTDFNLDSLTDTLIQGIDDEAAKTMGDNVMLKMGSDFHYQSAIIWYKSLDKLIDSVMNKRPDLNLFYSTPEQYTIAKAAENIDWTTKLDDFFPYRDCSACNWAGYYTSRPGVKRLERVSGSTNQLVKQMAASHLATDTATDAPGIKVAQKAMLKLTAANGVVNHHDAITGTAKQHVTDDWMKTLSDSLAEGESFVGATAASLSGGGGGGGAAHALTACRYANESICEPTQTLKPGMSLNVVVYNALPRASSQQVTVLLGASAGARGVAVAVTDSVSGDGVAAQLMSRSPDPSAGTIDRAGRAPAPFRLVFDAANVGPLASRVFTVTMSTDTDGGRDEALTMMAESVELGSSGSSGSSDESDAITISNGEVTVSFSRATGLMSTITRHASNLESWRLSDRHHGSLEDLQQSEVSIDVTQDMAFYKAWQPGPTDPMLSDKRDPHLQNLEPAHFALSNKDVGVDGVAKSVRGSSSQPAGAYIFRTQQSDETPTPIRSPKNPSGRVGLRVTHGDLVSEVVQTFSDWAVQTVRVRAGSPHVEVEWTVGEVPVSDGWGKEVISTIDASASMKDTGAMLYTDSNGREFMPRARDLETEEFVAGNYYPLSTSAYVKDEGLGVQMSVLVDRGEGCASLKDGAMELLLHRRLLVDDWRGVGESLNETTGGVTPYPDWVHQGSGITVRGTYAILVSPLANGLKELRQGMDEAYLPAYPLFTPAARATLASGDARPAPSEIASLTGGAALPINVHLLTLEPWSHNQLLVRLAHQFAVDEDPLYSQDAIVDLGALLSRYTVKGATEMSLSANMERSEMEARRLQWTHTDVDAAASATSFTEEGEEDEEARRLNIFHKPKHRPAPNDMPHPPARDPAKDSAAADAAAAAAAAAVFKKSSKDVHGAQAHSAPGDPFHKHRLPPIEFPHPPPAKASPAAPAAELAEGAAAHKPSEHDSEYLSRHAQFLAAARANAIKQANLKGKGFVSPFHKHPPPPNDFPHPPERVPETETPGAEKGRGKAGAGPRAGAGAGAGPGPGPGGRGIRSDGPPRRDPHGAPGPFPDHRPPPNDFPLPHRGGDGHGGGHGEFAHALPSGRIGHGPVRNDRGDVPDSRHLATVEAPSDVGVSPPAPQGSLDGDTHNDFPHRRLSGDADLTVTLTPMQVRTFIVDVSV